MYTRFSGDNGQSPARWLRTIKYRLPTTFTPSRWLECVDSLLDGEAARWADKLPIVKKILSDENVKYAHGGDVHKFKTLLLSRFPPDDKALESTDYLIKTLLQNPTESLEEYYGRTVDLLYASGGRDDIQPFKLSSPERSILSTVISHFVIGLHHSCLQSNSAIQSYSLLQAYQTTRRDERKMLAMGKDAYEKMENEHNAR